MSARRDTWKVWSSASLLDYTKLKKGNGALHSLRAYIHGSTMPNNTAQSLRSTGGSPLGLDHRYHECLPRCLESAMQCLFIRLYKAEERKWSPAWLAGLYTWWHDA